MIYIQSTKLNFDTIQKLPSSKLKELQTDIKELPFVDNDSIDVTKIKQYINEFNKKYPNNPLKPQEIDKIIEIVDFILEFVPQVENNVLLDEQSDIDAIYQSIIKAGFQDQLKLLLGMKCKYCENLHPEKHICEQKQVENQKSLESEIRYYYKKVFEIPNALDLSIPVQTLKHMAISNRINQVVIPSDQNKNGCKLYHWFYLFGSTQFLAALIDLQEQEEYEEQDIISQFIEVLMNYTGLESGSDDDHYRIKMEMKNLIDSLSSSKNTPYRVFAEQFRVEFGECTITKLQDNVCKMWLLHQTTIKLFVDEAQYLIVLERDKKFMLNIKSTDSYIMTRLETVFITFFSISGFTVNTDKVHIESHNTSEFEILKEIKQIAIGKINYKKIQDKLTNTILEKQALINEINRTTDQKTKRNAKNRLVTRENNIQTLNQKLIDSPLLDYNIDQLNFIKAVIRIFTGCLEIAVTNQVQSNITQDISNIYQKLLKPLVAKKLVLEMHQLEEWKTE